MRRDRQCRQVAARNGVAVGRGFRCDIDAQHPTRAGAAVHNDLVTENLTQFLREDASEDISVGTRTVGKNVTDGAIRIIANRIGSCAHCR